MNDVCKEVVQLAAQVDRIATQVNATAIVMAQMQATDTARDQTLSEHRKWLDAHQAIMERMAASEQDRISIHGLISQIDKDDRERARELVGSLRWAVGVGLTLAGLLAGAVAHLAH